MPEDIFTGMLDLPEDYIQGSEEAPERDRRYDYYFDVKHIEPNIDIVENWKGDYFVSIKDKDVKIRVTRNGSPDLDNIKTLKRAGIDIVEITDQYGREVVGFKSREVKGLINYLPVPKIRERPRAEILPVEYIFEPKYGIAIRKNYRGDIILVRKSNGREELITNIAKPYREIKANIKRKLWLAKNRPSAVPESLRWMPVAINYLDDAQDMLVTALSLAMPILKRVVKAPIPGVGWAFIASDVMNMVTNTLGTAMTPGMQKIQAINADPKLRSKIKNPGAYYAKIMARGGWRTKLSFVAQGLQASDTLTGYGLQLGGIMGGLSDTNWATMKFLWEMMKPLQFGDEEKGILERKKAYKDATRAAKGIVDGSIKTVEKLWNDAKALLEMIKTKQKIEPGWEPEDTDALFGTERSPIEKKALRVLLQFPQLANIIHILDDEDVINIIIAQRLAISVMADQPAPLNEERAEIINMLPFPTAIPVNPVSVEVLRDAGIRIEDSIPALDMSHTYPTIGHAIDEAFEKQDYLEKEIRKRAERDPETWYRVWDIWREGGFETLERLTPFKESEDLTYDSNIISAAMLADYNVALEWPYTDHDLQVWWLGAIREAEVSGRDYPGEEDWINSALKNNLRWKKKV